MLSKLEELIEISEYVNNLDCASTLNKMKSTLKNGNYILTVMGQFSAGKSTLINALLEKDVLPVNKTETTAIVTYLKYGEEDYAEIVYNDGTTKNCTVEETIKLEQNTDSAEELSSIESINIYISSPVLKNGLIIADTPGVNTVLKEHTDKTVQLFETSSRILYVVSGAMSLFDREFLNTLKEKGLKAIVVRTYMDTIYSDEDDPAEIVKSESELFKEFTDEPVFFTSSRKENAFFENISKLRKYISVNIADQASAQLEKAIKERAEFIGDYLLPQVKQREAALSSILNSNEAEYKKQREELEKQAEKLERTFESGRKKLESRYSEMKNDAVSSLEAKSKTEIRNLSDFINKKDFSSTFGIHSEIEDMLHKSCQNLRVSFVSGFDQIIKDNKEEVLNEISSYDFPVNLSVNLPESIDEASEAVCEIEDKISALLMLQDSIDSTIAESKERIVSTEEEKAQIEMETRISSEAQDALKRELSEYGDYVERYKIRQGDHSNERKMKNIGKIADFATILIPGEAWVNIGGKILKGTQVAAKGAKAAKQVDTAADIIRGIHMLKKNGMESKNDEGLSEYCGEELTSTSRLELQNIIDSQKQAPNILDLLSLEFYFSKIGKKFDTPDMVVVDEEYRRRYEAGRKEITDRINDEARKSADARIKLLNIDNKKEQDELYIREQEKRKIKASQDITSLERELENARKDQVNSVSAGFYIDAVTAYINDFCSDISKSVMPTINEKFEKYIESYGIEIESEIARQRNLLDDLDAEFSNADNAVLEEELSECRRYVSVLSGEI